LRTAAAAINVTSGVTAVNRAHTAIKTRVRIAAAAGRATCFGGKRVAAARAVITALSRRIRALHIIAGDDEDQTDQQKRKYHYFPQDFRCQDSFHFLPSLFKN
jgi:hypothetical protein